MKYTNSWKSNAKQNDKLDFIIRIGKITFIKLNVDFGKKKFIFTLLNFGIKN